MTYAYDANGNLTSTSSGQSFAWDVFNRMTSATGGGGTATYTYNGDGLKLRRIGPDGTTRYYHDGIRPIWEADGAGSMTAQLDRDIFGNLLSRKEPAGTRRHYHFDGLGSTTALSDEGGVAVATLLYDAWGNQRAASGATVPNYRFTGAELDSATGLYHIGARFYDPAIGRWLGEDPVKNDYFNPMSLNLYAYALLSPTGAIDETGAVSLETIFGYWVHRRVESWFLATFHMYNPRTEYNNAAGRLDMMRTVGGIVEVYELKPRWHLGDRQRRSEAMAQVKRYAGAVGGVPGTSWQPQGGSTDTIDYNWLFDVKLYSDPNTPGVIGYEVVPKTYAAEALAKANNWNLTFAALVLAILTAMCNTTGSCLRGATAAP